MWRFGVGAESRFSENLHHQMFEDWAPPLESSLALAADTPRFADFSRSDPKLESAIWSFALNAWFGITERLLFREGEKPPGGAGK